MLAERAIHLSLTQTGMQAYTWPLNYLLFHYYSLRIEDVKLSLSLSLSLSLYIYIYIYHPKKNASLYHKSMCLDARETRLNLLQYDIILQSHNNFSVSEIIFRVCIIFPLFECALKGYWSSQLFRKVLHYASSNR